MSIELVLVPMAIAAVSAWQAKRAIAEDGRQVIAVSTRMRNQDLLERALIDTRANVTRHNDNLITATWHHAQGRFTRDTEGIWSLHLAGDTDYDQATALVADIDINYGRHVQQDVLARLRTRAPEVGMSVESETTEDDHSVTLVLNVNAGTSA